MVMVQTYLSWQISCLFKKPPCRSDCILNISRMTTVFNPAPVLLRAKWTSTWLKQNSWKNNKREAGAIWSHINKNVLQSPAHTHIAEKGITRVLLTEQSDRVDAWDTSVPCPCSAAQHLPAQGASPSLWLFPSVPGCGSAFHYGEKKMHCRRYICKYICIYTSWRVGNPIRLGAPDPCCSVGGNEDSANVQGIALLISAPSAGGEAYTPIERKAKVI